MEHLLFVGSVHALFTTLFLMTKRARSLNDTVLAVWMVFIALPLISGAAVQTWPDLHIPVLRADLIYPLTYGPFMWLYVGTLTGNVVRITRRHLAHFLPFVAVSLIQLVSGWAPSPPNPEMATFSTSIRIIGSVNLTLLLAYTVAVFLRLRRHDRLIAEHFSNLPSYVTLSWLRRMTVAITAVFLLLFLAAALSLPVLMELHLYALVASVLGLSFFGLRQDRVFINTEAPDGNANEPVMVSDEESGAAQPTSTNARYDRSGLTSERADTIARKLDTFMRNERPYLDADLTIEALSKRMAVPRHHLTEVISKRHQKNFYLFVNEYRIQAVQQAMKSPSQQDQTLLDIAYACGFNSKSPFNTAFKTLTGMTPSQYRRKLAVL